MCSVHSQIPCKTWKVFISIKSEEKYFVLFLHFWNLDLFIFIYSPVGTLCGFLWSYEKINTEWPQLHYANIVGGTVLRDHLRLAAAASDAGKLKSKIPPTQWNSVVNFTADFIVPAVMYCSPHIIVTDVGDPFHLWEKTFLNSFYQLQSFICIKQRILYVTGLNTGTKRSPSLEWKTYSFLAIWAFCKFSSQADSHGWVEKCVFLIELQPAAS